MILLTSNSNFCYQTNQLYFVYRYCQGILYMVSDDSFLCRTLSNGLRIRTFQRQYIPLSRCSLNNTIYILTPGLLAQFFSMIMIDHTQSLYAYQKPHYHYYLNESKFLLTWSKVHLLECVEIVWVSTILVGTRIS